MKKIIYLSIALLFLSSVLGLMFNYIDFTSNQNLALNNPADSILYIQRDTIPAGMFEMGNSYENYFYDNIIVEQANIRSVKLDGFLMGRFEVTNLQFAYFLNTCKIKLNGIYPKATYANKELFTNDLINSMQFDETGWHVVKEYKNHPVTFVTWYGAYEFAKFIGGRLPTEAEWEYACHADGEGYSFDTEGICVSAQNANFLLPSDYSKSCGENAIRFEKTAPVNSFNPNKWGLYNMQGNVSEWCSDWYGEYPDYAQYNPQGPTDNRMFKVIRGGGWQSDLWRCRSVRRDFYSPDCDEKLTNMYFDKYWHYMQNQSNPASIGFRVVFDL
jgi:formylglycine-generating enzyme required for sulfatase activity